MNNEEARGLEKPGQSWAFCSEVYPTTLGKNKIKIGTYAEVRTNMWPYLEKQV